MDLITAHEDWVTSVMAAIAVVVALAYVAWYIGSSLMKE